MCDGEAYRDLCRERSRELGYRLIRRYDDEEDY